MPFAKESSRIHAVPAPGVSTYHPKPITPLWPATCDARCGIDMNLINRVLPLRTCRRWSTVIKATMQRGQHPLRQLTATVFFVGWFHGAAATASIKLKIGWIGGEHDTIDTTDSVASFLTAVRCINMDPATHLGNASMYLEPYIMPVVSSPGQLIAKSPRDLNSMLTLRQTDSKHWRRILRWCHASL